MFCYLKNSAFFQKYNGLQQYYVYCSRWNYSQNFWKTWAEFIEERIMKPVGMTASFGSYNCAKSVENKIDAHAPVNGKSHYSSSDDWNERQIQLVEFWAILPIWRLGKILNEWFCKQRRKTFGFWEKMRIFCGKFNQFLLQLKILMIPNLMVTVRLVYFDVKVTVDSAYRWFNWYGYAIYINSQI